MSLKNKALPLFFYALLLPFLSLGIWTTLELNKCRNTITALESQFIVSEYAWMENLKVSSQIYADFFNHKESFQEKTGNKTSVLIYRFSKYMCESCIQEDMQEIELFQKEVGKEKILLLPAYPNDRTGNIELSNVLAKFNYVNIPVDSLLIPSQGGDFMQRYFAAIDKEGNLTMVFIPHRGKTDLTRNYFSEVKKLIFD